MRILIKVYDVIRRASRAIEIYILNFTGMLYPMLDQCIRIVIVYIAT